MTPYFLSKAAPNFEKILAATALLMLLIAPLVLGVSLLEVLQSVRGAFDRSLLGIVFGWAIPVSTWLLVANASAFGRLGSSSAALGRLGYDRRKLAVKSLAFSCFTAALSAVAYVWLAFIATTRAFTGPAFFDALTSSWIAMIGAVAYVGWFSFWSTVGGRGGGRFVGLLVDWLLGIGTGLGALLSIRGNLTNLLGGAAPFGVNPLISTTLILFIAAVFAAWSLHRIDP